MLEDRLLLCHRTAGVQGERKHAGTEAVIALRHKGHNFIVAWGGGRRRVSKGLLVYGRRVA